MLSRDAWAVKAQARTRQERARERRGRGRQTGSHTSDTRFSCALPRARRGARRARTSRSRPYL